jgi:hypothetical protein
LSVAALLKEARRLRARRLSPTGDTSPEVLALAGGLEALDPWQRALLGTEADKVLLNISRQAGKSTMAGVLAAHEALAVPGSLTLVLAPSERQAKETFAKAAGFIPHEIPADSYRKLGVQLANGSRVEALPGTEKTIRGFSGVSLLILDEAARVADELYYAVRPMLAVSGGKLIMASTPYGKRGVFYREWTEGEGWERFEVPAEMCPRIPAVFLEEERRAMPAAQFAQEYECSFEETEMAVFSAGDIEGAVTDDVQPLFAAGPIGGVA